MKFFSILTIVSIFLVLSAVHQVEAVPPASTQDLYDWHDVILLGKVISKNSTFSPTHFSYEIKVEKYLKNPQPYSIINAAGLNRLNPNLANTVFEVGDRGLFFLNNYTQKYDSNNPFTISIRSIKAQPEWDSCNLFDKEIPREHWVFGPGSVSPKIFQGNETNIDNFSTNKEILISYDFLNHTPETKYFEFGASITQWDNSTRPVVFRESQAFSLKPCTVYKTITLSFVPTNAGHYSFELYDPLGTRFGIGFAVHDESSSEFVYPVPGSGIIADTLPIKKQFELGLGVNELKCKDDLQLVFKSSNTNPACVKLDTKTKLIQRGWAINDYHPIFAVVIELPVLNDYANLPPNHVKITLGKQIDDYDSGVTFHPPSIKTIIGYNNTVTWINENEKPVKLESDDGYFDVEIKPGESFSARFDKIGVYKYHSPDNWKRGTIIVSTQEIESSHLVVSELFKRNSDEIANTIALALIPDDKIVKKRLDNTIMSAYVTDEDADIIVPKALCSLCSLNYYDPIEYRYGITKGLVYPKDESAALDFAKDFLAKIGYNMDGSEWIDKVNFGDRIEVSIQQRAQGWIIPNHFTRFEFYKDHTWISLGRWYNDVSEYKFKLSQDEAKKIAKEYMDLEVKNNPNLQKYEYRFESVSDGIRVIIFDDKPLYAVPISYKASAKMNYENGHCGGPEFFTAYVMVEGQKGDVLGWDYSACM